MDLEDYLEDGKGNFKIEQNDEGLLIEVDSNKICALLENFCCAVIVFCRRLIENTTKKNHGLIRIYLKALCCTIKEEFIDKLNEDN